jgi:hypothetical protein
MGSGDNDIILEGTCKEVLVGAGENVLFTGVHAHNENLILTGAGNTELTLIAPYNYLVIEAEKDYAWSGDNLIISFNNKEIIIKDYNPEDITIKVYVDEVDLSTLVPNKEKEITL